MLNVVTAIIGLGYLCTERSRHVRSLSAHIHAEAILDDAANGLRLTILVVVGGVGPTALMIMLSEGVTGGLFSRNTTLAACCTLRCWHPQLRDVLSHHT